MQADAVETSFTDELVDALRRFADARIDPMAIDQSASIPSELLEELAELGVFGLSIPERYGGMELGLGDVCQAVAALAERDRSVATTVGLHLGLGTRGMTAFGSAELCGRYLPDLAAGTKLAAFAATEAGAGSDLQGVATRGVAQGEGLVINGTKIFVTNGALAQVYTVLASTPGLGGRRRGYSLIALEDTDAGLTVGAEEHKLGICGSSTTSVFLDDVQVAHDRVIGEPGYGMEQAGHVLAWGRTAMASGCVGTARTALKAAFEHTGQRRQFGKALAQFPVVQEQLADLASLHFAMGALVQYTADSVDDAQLNRRSVVTKVLCSEGNWEICDRAVQLHGGSGFIEETALPLLMRDARITRIFEGANDVLMIHLGAMEATSKPGPTRPLVSELAQRVEHWRTELKDRHGLRLLRKQRLLHRLGALRILRESSEAVVIRANREGTRAAWDLAAHWIDMAGRRASAELIDRPEIETLSRIAERCADGVMP